MSKVPTATVGKRGISLVEILAVVSIVGVLAAIAIPRITTNGDEAKRNACFATQGDIEMQVQLYYRNENAWPATNLSDMQPPGSYAYFPQGTPLCPVDGSAYTIDPTTHDVIGHSH